MNNKKQNSVIFLIEKIAENQLQRDFTMFEWAKIFEEAIAMHKDEMIEFSQEVFRNRYNQVYQSLGSIADDKYNETFGGQDNE